MVTIRARKKIDVGCISAILTLKIKEKRPDIVALLDHMDKLNISDGEKENLGNYLEKYLNLIKDGRLTGRGETATRTGYVWMPEFGRYDIYYIKDKVIGDRVIHFDRMSPEGFIKENIEEFTDYSHFDEEEHISWKRNEQEFYIKFNTSNGSIPKVARKDYIGAAVEIIHDSKSGTKLKVESSDHEFRHAEDCDSFLPGNNLERLVKNWRNDISTQLVSFDEIKSNTTILTTFKRRLDNNQVSEKNLYFSWGKDDGDYTIEIDGLDVLPKTMADAKKWLYALLVMGLKDEKSYFTIDYILDKEKLILDNTPLKRLYDNLFIDGKEALQLISNDSQCDGIALNIRIAQDLYPEEFVSGKKEAL